MHDSALHPGAQVTGSPACAGGDDGGRLVGPRPRVDILSARTSITYCCAQPVRRSTVRETRTRMCLLCEELWMAFELPPEAKARTFVADTPEPDDASGQIKQTAAPPSPEASSDDGERPAAG